MFLTKKGDVMKLALLIGISIALVSSYAAAQGSLGELLDAGGKKLSKTEIMAVLGGANLSGLSKTGGLFQADFKPDGTYAGTVQSAQGKSGGMFGTWIVDESGKVCTEFTTSLGAAGSSKRSNCAYFYKSGDAYYVVESDTDRSALALSRTVKK
jgi:hypothetical protein